MLITAIAMLQPAAALSPTLQLPTVEPTRLEIRSGRLGGPVNTITFDYAQAGASRDQPMIRFTGTFFDPRSRTTSQRATDSIACPDAASILRAVPAFATATRVSSDAPMVIVLHGSTYSLSGWVRSQERQTTHFTLTGDSRAPLRWWTDALFSALQLCWLSPDGSSLPEPPPAAR